MEKFPISAQLWIQHNFQRTLHHKSLLFPAHQQLPESPSQSCDMEAGCAQTPELCSVHWPKVPHHCSAFPCQCHPLLLYFLPSAQTWAIQHQEPFSFSPPSRLGAALQHWKLCCTFFLTPSSAAQQAAERVLISHPLVAVLTQFSGFYFLDASVGHSAGFIKLGWQFAETTGADFARIITQLHVQSHKPCAQVNNSTSAGPL